MVSVRECFKSVREWEEHIDREELRVSAPVVLSEMVRVLMKIELKQQMMRLSFYEVPDSSSWHCLFWGYLLLLSYQPSCQFDSLDLICSRIRRKRPHTFRVRFKKLWTRPRLGTRNMSEDLLASRLRKSVGEGGAVDSGSGACIITKVWS